MDATAINNFRSLLAKNRLGLVLKELQDQLANTEYQNATLQLAARHAALQQDLLNQIVSDKESRQQENRLIRDCLMLLDQINKGVPFLANDAEESNPPSITKNVVRGDIHNSNGTINIGDNQKK